MFRLNSPYDLEDLREEIARRVLEYSANKDMTADEITRVVLSSFGIVRGPIAMSLKPSYVSLKIEE